MKKSTFLTLFTLLLSAGLEVCACLVPGFSDSWRSFFPVTGSIFSYLTSLTPVSVGEIMIICGLVWLAVLAVLFISVIIFFIFRRRSQWFTGLRAFFNGYLRATFLLIGVISLIMVCNCFILFHCTSLRKTMPDRDASSFTSDDLERLREMIVERCNNMAAQMERDENGTVLSPSESDMQAEAKKCIERLSSDYPDLKGFRSFPKPLAFSGFMCQQDMMGYFFPFSMEANYNTLMEDLNKPYTMCHELSHTHGYIYEDEANFLAYLACLSSDNDYFVYSGYLGILWYVDNEFYYDVGKTEYWQHTPVSDLVRYDATFLSKETLTKVEENAILPTEVVKSGADTFVDTTLKVNGVSSGKKSYSEVVTLLLMYYDT